MLTASTTSATSAGREKVLMVSDTHARDQIMEYKQKWLLVNLWARQCQG